MCVCVRIRIHKHVCTDIHNMDINIYALFLKSSGQVLGRKARIFGFAGVAWGFIHRGLMFGNSIPGSPYPEGPYILLLWN